MDLLCKRPRLVCVLAPPRHTASPSTPTCIPHDVVCFLLQHWHVADCVIQPLQAIADLGTSLNCLVPCEVGNL